jgi:hypothetical protein
MRKDGRRKRVEHGESERETGFELGLCVRMVTAPGLHAKDLMTRCILDGMCCRINTIHSPCTSICDRRDSPE